MEQQPAVVANENESNGRKMFENKDEMIIQQQREIEKEISETTPLISDLEQISTLDAEYSDDPIYANKVADLASKYLSLRRTRPDGNCFFRAFAYSYMTYMTRDRAEFEKFKKIATDSKDKLIKMGFSTFTLVDFHDIFMEVVDRVGAMIDRTGVEDAADADSVHKIFNEQGYSDYVVVYLRLITSGQIQENANFYQDFVVGCFGTIEEFRHKEVEPMFKESDHIHIIALCSALDVGVRVEYMDRGDGEKVNFHDFPDNKKPVIFLLYRPGHYDILYPKEEADSSATTPASV